MSVETPTAVDLFCGAGGLSLGFKEAGFRSIFAADFDPYACATYAANIGPHVAQMDLGATSEHEIVRRLKRFKRPDVVVGGPPCQGFSIQRRGATEDERNNLVVKFASVAIALRPKAIVMENVPTLLGERGRVYLDRAIALMDAAGFDVQARVLEAADYGVPQYRRRAVLVAIDRQLGGEFAYPQATHGGRPVTVREALKNLPEPPVDFSEHPSFPNHRRVKISDINIERIRHVPEGGGRLDIPLRLQLPCHLNSNGHRHLDVFGRMSWSLPAPTLTAMFDNFTRGRFAHPVENRNITAREGARLQSFPDSFVFCGPKKNVARQIGNAVPPRLAQAVAAQLLKFLSEAEERAACRIEAVIG